ncbi:MAG TPA: tetratricopeptide repeat protein [Vicinamibacterales bacterium]|nr:tetratricopeptide repeat protein [Vicinamibacterales bacterium]
MGVTLALALTMTAAGIAQQPEATSLSGKPLVRISLPDQQKLEANLAQAQKDLAADPGSADAIIWVGRRLGYLWRYRDAIDMFSRGIAAHPSDARMYRHRGHRYITVRDFDSAIKDFEKAVSLIDGRPDQIEPDGQPNAAGRPRSTLQFNIWYHLGLAHFLKADYAKALDAYNECMKVSNNDDSVTATSDWMWMTLMRLDRKAEAARVLERITPKMDILENGSYHRRLLMYKGLEKPEALLDPANADGLTIATQGYGVGNWYFVNGDTARARQIFEKVLASPNWSAFGYIAAEADLERMR